MKCRTAEEFYSTIAACYDRYLEEVASDDEIRQVIGMITHALPTPCAVLDVGCGTGRIALPLQEAGYQVTGIDVSDAMVKEASSKGLKRCITGDITAGLELEGFDALLSIRMGFSYVKSSEDMISLLGHCRGFLAAGGQVIWDTPNAGFFGDRRELVCGKEYSGMPENVEFECTPHFRHDIEAVFESCGFEVIESWGDYDMSRCGDQSPRVITWAKKQECSGER